MCTYVHYVNICFHMCECECVTWKECACIGCPVLNCLLIGRYTLKEYYVYIYLIEFFTHLCAPQTLWLIRSQIAASEI